MKTNWTYKDAYNRALKELQDKSMQEFKQLKASAKQADKIMKKMQAKEKKDD